LSNWNGHCEADEAMRIRKHSESHLVELDDGSRWQNTVFRDTIFATGRAQAANNAGLRFGTGLILGFAVGGL